MRVFGATKYGSGAGQIHYSNVVCMGTEANFADCTAVVSPTNCDHTEDAGLRCEISEYNARTS